MSDFAKAYAVDDEVRFGKDLKKQGVVTELFQRCVVIEDSKGGKYAVHFASAIEHVDKKKVGSAPKEVESDSNETEKTQESETVEGVPGEVEAVEETGDAPGTEPAEDTPVDPATVGEAEDAPAENVEKTPVEAEDAKDGESTERLY